MKSVLANAIASSNLGIYPSIALLVLLATMLALIFWTFRPHARQQYDADARLAFDELGD